MNNQEKEVSPKDIAPKWVVIDNSSGDVVIGPINPFSQFVASETFGFGDPYTYENENWKEFESKDIHHVFIGLEPGKEYDKTFSAEDLEFVFQYDDGGRGWYDQMTGPAYEFDALLVCETDFDKFTKEWAGVYNTRIAIRLKQQPESSDPKEETVEIPNLQNLNDTFLREQTWDYIYDAIDRYNNKNELNAAHTFADKVMDLFKPFIDFAKAERIHSTLSDRDKPQQAEASESETVEELDFDSAECFLLDEYKILLPLGKDNAIVIMARYAAQQTAPLHQRIEELSKSHDIADVALKGAENYIDTLEKKVAQLEAAQGEKWISVEDRLPEDREGYLVVNHHGEVQKAWYDTVNNIWTGIGDLKYPNPYLWQPLPNPPATKQSEVKP